MFGDTVKGCPFWYINFNVPKLDFGGDFRMLFFFRFLKINNFEKHNKCISKGVFSDLMRLALIECKRANTQNSFTLKRVQNK